MFILFQIVQTAQGGRLTENLARQFDLSPEVATKCVNLLLPPLSGAFLTKAAQPGGYAVIQQALADPQHRRVFEQGGAAAEPETMQKGCEVVAAIFGSAALVKTLTDQAASMGGVSAATLIDILPILTSVLIGGTAASMERFGAAAKGAMPGLPGGFDPAAFTSAWAMPPVGGAQWGGFTGAMPGAQGMIPPALQAGLDAWAKMFRPPGSK